MDRGILHKSLADHFPELSYSSVPLGVFLDKGCEVFLETKNRVIPLRLLMPGDIFGAFEVTDYLFHRKKPVRWSISSGARSIFILNKLSDAIALKRLRRKYSFSSMINGKHFEDHWSLFQHISADKTVDHCWNSQLVFFTEHWFKHFGDPAWEPFYNLIFKRSWGQAQLSVDRTAMVSLWQHVLDLISERGISPNHYMLDTVKHLLLIAQRKGIGYTPTIGEETLFPAERVTNALIDVYQTKYHPTFMYANSLDVIKEHEQVYYSLSHPCLLEGIPYQGKRSKTVMADLRGVKMLVDTLRDRAHGEREVGNLLEHAMFQYYHVEHDPCGEIQESQVLPNTDSRLLTQLTKCELPFCDTSIFWRGAIQIALG
ncbi:MAG: hypothetical protein DHS20C10_12040 [marine bacterium B5-7]|nr:MAG: hypothetical protein DHS20C10_12040 [marine bacterium B5-7]